MADFWSAEKIVAPDGTVSVISAEERPCTLLENVIAISTLFTWFGWASDPSLSFSVLMYGRQELMPPRIVILRLTCE